jgi:hypothetical protein
MNRPQDQPQISGTRQKKRKVPFIISGRPGNCGQFSAHVSAAKCVALPSEQIARKPLPRPSRSRLALFISLLQPPSPVTRHPQRRSPASPAAIAANDGRTRLADSAETLDRAALRSGYLACSVGQCDRRRLRPAKTEAAQSASADGSVRETTMSAFLLTYPVFPIPLPRIESCDAPSIGPKTSKS